MYDCLLLLIAELATRRLIVVDFDEGATAGMLCCCTIVDVKANLLCPFTCLLFSEMVFVLGFIREEGNHMSYRHNLRANLE